MDYDLIIIGAGPAGYAAAVRAGQVGMKAVIIEKSRIGGMCLNWGCIPSKAMLESAKFYRRLSKADEFGVIGLELNGVSFAWKKALTRANQISQKLAHGIQALLEKYGIGIIYGEAQIVSPTSVEVEKRLFSAHHIVIATGSRPDQQGLSLPAKMVLEIDRLFLGDDIPDPIVVLGEVPPAVEIAQLFAMIGKEIVLVAESDRLMPMADPCLSRFVLEKLRQSGVKVMMEAVLEGHYEGGIVVSGQKIPCVKVVNARKRKAILPSFRLDLQMQDGSIQVNDFFETNVPTIYAVGDVIGGNFQFAHVASAQGVNVVNVINGIRRKMDYSCHPINLYSEPEMAQVGYTEPQIQAAGVSYKVTHLPLSANGKALAEGNSDGFIRLLSEQKYGEVLGVQIVASHATDMIAEAVAIIQMEGTIFDVSKIIHAHPTTSEIFLEAGYAAMEE